MDDLVIIARRRELCEKLINFCPCQFELNGLEINCDKSNIMGRKDAEDSGMRLESIKGTEIGRIEMTEKYKYLGVTLSKGKIYEIFKSHRANIASKLKSRAGLVLQIAKEHLTLFKWMRAPQKEMW